MHIHTHTYRVAIMKVKHRECRRHKRCRFDPWVGKIPWRRKWQPTPVLLPENPMDGVTWWAIGHGISKSWTWLEWLSSWARTSWVISLSYQVSTFLSKKWELKKTSKFPPSFTDPVIPGRKKLQAKPLYKRFFLAFILCNSKKGTVWASFYANSRCKDGQLRKRGSSQRVGQNCFLQKDAPERVEFCFLDWLHWPHNIVISFLECHLLIKDFSSSR